MMRENIADIEERIQAACKRAGRDRAEVTLIAVSKTKPNSMIMDAYDLGMRHFGENKVQELSQKYEELNGSFEEEVYWHQIGHLQRNKVKYIVGKTVLIHSVDSLRLANQIEEEAAKIDIICDILIEVNIAKEDTKFGVAEEDVFPLLLEIAKLEHVRVRGLMTIAPYVENQEENRTYFRKLDQLIIDINSKNIDNMINREKISLGENTFFGNNSPLDILSMGMTGDFEVAIEEGATLIRVGTGIFGERKLADCEFDL